MSSERTASPPIASELAPFVHLHIPKTAGTSLRRVLASHFGDDRLLHYDPTARSFNHVSNMVASGDKTYIERAKRMVYAVGLTHVALPAYKLLRRQMETDEAMGPDCLERRDFDVLTGHITAEQLAAWNLGALPVVSTVRHPLERSLSQYRHVQRTGAVAFQTASRDARTMSFEEYIEQPELTNVQSRYLAALSLRYVASVQTVGNLLSDLGLSHDLPHLNGAPKPGHLELGTTARRAFEQRNAADYELFAVADQSWR